MPHLTYLPPVESAGPSPFPDSDFVPAITERVFDLMSPAADKFDLGDPAIGGIYGMHLAGPNGPSGRRGVFLLELTGLYNELRAGDDDERVRIDIGPGVLAAAVGRLESYRLDWIKHVELDVAIGSRAYRFSTRTQESYPKGIAYPLDSPEGKGLMEVRHGAYWLGEQVAEEIPDEFDTEKKEELDTTLQEAFTETTGLPLEIRHLFDMPGEEGANARRLIGCGVTAAFIARFPDSVDDEARKDSAEAMSAAGTTKLRETIPRATTYLSGEPGNGHGALGVAATATEFEMFLSDNMN